MKTPRAPSRRTRESPGEGTRRLRRRGAGRRDDAAHLPSKARLPELPGWSWNSSVPRGAVEHTDRTLLQDLSVRISRFWFVFGGSRSIASSLHFPLPSLLGSIPSPKQGAHALAVARCVAMGVGHGDDARITGLPSCRPAFIQVNEVGPGPLLSDIISGSPTTDPTASTTTAAGIHALVLVSHSMVRSPIDVDSLGSSCKWMGSLAMRTVGPEAGQGGASYAGGGRRSKPAESPPLPPAACPRRQHGGRGQPGGAARPDCAAGSHPGARVGRNRALPISTFRVAGM